MSHRTDSVKTICAVHPQIRHVFTCVGDIGPHRDGRCLIGCQHVRVDVRRAIQPGRIRHMLLSASGQHSVRRSPARMTVVELGETAACEPGEQAAHRVRGTVEPCSSGEPDRGTSLPHADETT
jgi:hypothetical protein